MQSNDLQEIFMAATSEVLETMFFTAVIDRCPEEPATFMLAAELTFHGSSSGRFGVRVPMHTGELIASSFLGIEDANISLSQVEEVVCELTNMICGSVLSRVEAGANFELSHPEINPNHPDWRDDPRAEGCTLSLEEGTLTVWMTAEETIPEPVCAS